MILGQCAAHAAAWEDTYRDYAAWLARVTRSGLGWATDLPIPELWEWVETAKRLQMQD